MSNHSPSKRSLRVFLSSTFRDMHAEREELIKRVFPQIRKICADRGIAWTEIDLRWGVTDEQKSEGKVLPICLAEIDRSTVFIGILGDRYGWIPDEHSEQLLREYPWLANHPGTSVTELECIHGVLNRPAPTSHPLFYLRDPAYVRSLPAQEQSAFLEAATADEIREFGIDEAERRARQRREKLAALKSRIRASGHLVRDFGQIRQLGEEVRQDLTALIDRLYPPSAQPDLLERAAHEHRVFAEERAQAFVGRRQDLATITEHVDGSGPPLVVLGESGVGKSALLAQWFLERSRSDPREQIIAHFIGASPDSSDWAALVRRLLGEIRRRFHLDFTIPDQASALREELAQRLSQAAAKGRLVLLIDALDQLEDRQGAHELHWLPAELPAGVRLVVSTLPGRALDELRKRGWAIHTIAPLPVSERRDLIARYLGEYGKALSADTLQRIADAEPCGNSLYLRALLEELRLHGDHFTLEDRLRDYLAADTPEELFSRILSRYEHDYDGERPGLVRDVMSLLWGSRRGLAEHELLDLLGNESGPLPAAHWAPLRLAASASLTNRGERITFFHNYVREAAHNRCLQSPAAQCEAHVRIAAYLRRQDNDRRRVEELAWQYGKARDWSSLRDLLVDPAFLHAAKRHDHFEVLAGWALLEQESSHRVVDAFGQVLEDPQGHSMNHVTLVAEVMEDLGHPEEALRLRRHIADWCRQLGHRSGLAAQLGNQAVILMRLGRIQEAQALDEERTALARELGDKSTLMAALANSASLEQIQGRFPRALELYREQERLCRELGAQKALAACLGNQATLLQDRGEYDAALALFRQQQDLCRLIGDRDGLQLSLGNEAIILADRGDLPAAEKSMREKEAICRELGNAHGLQAAHYNLGTFLEDRGKLNEALRQYADQEAICRRLGNQVDLSASLCRQASVLQRLMRLPEALPKLDEAEALAATGANPRRLATCRHIRAKILRANGDHLAALPLVEEIIAIYREHGYRDNTLVGVLFDQAEIKQLSGHVQESATLFRSLQDLCRTLGHAPGLNASLNGEVLSLLHLGEHAAAEKPAREFEQRARRANIRDDLIASLINLGEISRRQGDAAAALRFLDEAEALARQQSQPILLANVLMARVADAQGDLSRLKKLLDEAESLYRQAGYDQGCQVIQQLRLQILSNFLSTKAVRVDPDCGVCNRKCTPPYIQRPKGAVCERCFEALVDADDTEWTDAEPLPCSYCGAPATWPSAHTRKGWFCWDCVFDGLCSIANRQNVQQWAIEKIERDSGILAPWHARAVALLRWHDLVAAPHLQSPAASERVDRCLIANLEFADHPLAGFTRQWAMVSLLDRGPEILPMLLKSVAGAKDYFLANIVIAAAAIAPHDPRVRGLLQYAEKDLDPAIWEEVKAQLQSPEKPQCL